MCNNTSALFHCFFPHIPTEMIFLFLSLSLCAALSWDSMSYSDGISFHIRVCSLATVTWDFFLHCDNNSSYTLKIFLVSLSWVVLSCLFLGLPAMQWQDFLPNPPVVSCYTMITIIFTPTGISFCLKPSTLEKNILSGTRLWHPASQPTGWPWRVEGVFTVVGVQAPAHPEYSPVLLYISPVLYISPLLYISPVHQSSTTPRTCTIPLIMQTVSNTNMISKQVTICCWTTKCLLHRVLQNSPYCLTVLSYFRDQVHTL